MVKTIGFILMMTNNSYESPLVEVPSYGGRIIENIDLCEKSRKEISNSLLFTPSSKLHFYCVPIIQVR